jgi:hypothetical protein
MSNTTMRYWYACVGEPVPIYSPQTGKFRRLIVECSDLVTGDDAIKDAIRTFVEFPAGLTMQWHEFESIQMTDKPKAPSTFVRQNAHIKIWLVEDKPGNIR